MSTYSYIVRPDYELALQLLKAQMHMFLLSLLYQLTFSILLAEWLLFIIMYFDFITVHVDVRPYLELETEFRALLTSHLGVHPRYIDLEPTCGSVHQLGCLLMQLVRIIYIARNRLMETKRNGNC